eukprot:NODE_426_length_8844_cov_0.449857.p3 type:complete len:212 gc:universal NODE_426_length_8844_cov_0.449857:2725-3360(+)
MPTVNTFPLIRTIIKRERTAGMYRSTSAFLSKFTSMIPQICLQICILILPIYWIIGLYDNYARYGYYILICALHISVAVTFGLAVGSAVKNIQVGQIITPIIAVIFIVFGGLFANLDSIGSWISWVQYISPIANTNKALVQNEFYTRTFDCAVKLGDRCLEVTGEDIVKNVGLNSPAIDVVMGVNLAVLGFFLLLGMLCFSRTTRPMLRLN